MKRKKLFKISKSTIKEISKLAKQDRKQELESQQIASCVKCFNLDFCSHPPGSN